MRRDVDLLGSFPVPIPHSIFIIGDSSTHNCLVFFSDSFFLARNAQGIRL
jgi:hypothetical protein